MIAIIIALAAGYLIGALPTSIWVCRRIKGIDIRTVGSGNAGATNVYRVLGKKMAIGVGLFDCLKGVAVVLLSKWLVPASEEIAILAGIVAILGHAYTVFAGFKGGKGVLVSLGVFLALAPLASVSAFAVWYLVFSITRMVSLGSITAAIHLPAFTYLFSFFGLNPVGKGVLLCTVLVAAFVVFTHRSNIKRIVSGAENKIEKKDRT